MDIPVFRPEHPYRTEARLTAPADPAPAAPEAPADGGAPAAAEDGSEPEFGFADLLDIINPLQHLPIVSTVYRALTGDEIKAPARILGGALFGGPFGFIASMVNTVAEEVSGRDLGETALAALFGDDAPGDTAVAEAAPPVLETQPSSLAIEDEVAAPTAAAPALTGPAALGALATDLRGVVSSVPAASQTTQIEARPLNVLPAAGQTFNAAVPHAAFTERMLNALEKYDALTAEGGRAGRTAGQTLDQRL